MVVPPLARRANLRAGIFLFAATGWFVATAAAQPAAMQQAVVFNVQEANERLEMIVNTSRILTLDRNIPRAQVNNPEILEITPISPNQVQILAKKAGVTQVNLWDEGEERIYTVDVIIYGDAQELEMVLRSQFPKSSLRVIPLANSVIVSGFVDRPDVVNRIIEIAQDYHPKVINNVSVGGVQQVLLHVKVMEISRTKLRTLGFDFVEINGDDFITSGVTGLLGNFTSATGLIETTGGETATFGILNNQQAFFGLLEALRENNLMKILAEPDLVAVSGRPSSFLVGGEFPILVPQSLGTVSIEYKKFGTQLDFVPIVLGNGRVRLEVRPRVSEIDSTRSVVINELVIPGLRVREVETGVEMMAGQTLAIAGLVQTRVENSVRAIPYLGDLPYLGAAFRRTSSDVNEVELLILVTPELVDALDPHEVPPGGPGLNSCNPNDCQLWWKGHIEVPCDPCARGGHEGDYMGAPMGGPGYGGLQMIEEGEPVPVPTPGTAPTPPASGTYEVPEGSSASHYVVPLPNSAGAVVQDTASTTSSRRRYHPAGPGEVVLQAPNVALPNASSAPLPPQPAPVMGAIPPTPPTALLPTRPTGDVVLPPATTGTAGSNTPPGLIGPLGYDVNGQK